MRKKFKDFWNKIKPYILPYAIAIAIPMTVGIVAAALTRDSMDIYDKLKVPPLAPPAILFPIVWTILYILMGISSAMIYVDRDMKICEAKSGLIWYGASLVLNFVWSIVFFNLQAALLAFIILLALLFTIIKTMFEYKKVKPIAARLQIPYAVWVTFAGYLNVCIWFLN